VCCCVDLSVLPQDDLTVLPTVLDSCGLYRGGGYGDSGSSSVGEAGGMDSYIPASLAAESILESSKRVVVSSFPPFFHYQTTFSDSRGQDPYCDVVTGKVTAEEDIIVRVKHNHREEEETKTKPKLSPQQKQSQQDTSEINLTAIAIDVPRPVSIPVPVLSRPVQQLACTDFSILAGMHSDQATEEIIDLALAHNMPFAVVPCCVFPKLFTHRKIPIDIYRKLLNKKRSEYSDLLVPQKRSLEEANAAAMEGLPKETKISKMAEELLGFVPVVSYEQFIMFLMLKSPRIKCVDLPFEGRNTVLYALPLP
jgi:hypothetical protein